MPLSDTGLQSLDAEEHTRKESQVKPHDSVSNKYEITHISFI